MTESDIGSGPHKRHPSQEIEVAVIKERLREAGKRDELLLRSNDDVKTAVHEIKLMLVKSEGRMAAIESSHEDTSALIRSLDARIFSVESDKRGPVAIILATVAALGSGIAAYFGISR